MNGCSGRLLVMNLLGKKSVVVVSGLPRSGTSMMMQMLEAGGVCLLTDHVRASDEDNVRGYFEFEPVKATKRDASWLSSAVGKAVKVVYLLLRDLPPAYDYRVIFMQRNLREVVRSQERMLLRRGVRGAPLRPEEMAGVFERQLQEVDQWLARQANFQRLDVPYRGVIADPLLQVERVRDFLGVPLEMVAMAAVVEPDLYRQRSDET